VRVSERQITHQNDSYLAIYSHSCIVILFAVCGRFIMTSCVRVHIRWWGQWKKLTHWLRHG